MGIAQEYGQELCKTFLYSPAGPSIPVRLPLLTKISGSGKTFGINDANCLLGAISSQLDPGKDSMPEHQLNRGVPSLDVDAPLATPVQGSSRHRVQFGQIALKSALSIVAQLYLLCLLFWEALEKFLSE